MTARTMAHLCIAGALSLGLSSDILAQLPGESTLPGRPPAPAAALPEESKLPPGFAVAAGPDDRQPAAPSESPTGPGARDSAAAQPPTAPARKLPSEGTLPPAAERPVPAAQDGDPAQAADLLRLAQSADAVPWLRLHMQGHVGPVRALAFAGDSTRLVSAGEDKSVLVWARLGEQDRWPFERAIHWQVQRGNRGRIYAIAMHDHLAAIGGHGAMAGLGEILLVDTRTGTLQAVLYDEQLGHQQVILSLAFSPDPQRLGLASIDRAGRALYWRPDPQTGLWKPREIQAADATHYGPAIAGQLTRARGVAPMVMVDGRHVVLPVYAADPRRPNRVTWQLAKINVTNGTKTGWPGQRQVFHVQMVTALAATGNGAQLASADAAGRLLLWNDQGLVASERLDRACIALAFTPDGRTLIAGTARSPAGQPARVQQWDVTGPGQLRRQAADIQSPHDVYACAVSPGGTHVAYSSGNDVVVRSLRSGEENRLRAAVRPPLRVAFAKDRPFYRIAFGTRKHDGHVPLEQTFDPTSGQLGAAANLDEQQWLADSWYQSGWNVETLRDARTGRESYYVTRQGRRQARIPFEPSRQGAPAAWCWIPTRDGKPFAVAIGTDADNNIYVLRLAARGTCPVLRVLRGHAGRVTSVGVSRDLRYLVSGSADATIRVWPLTGLHAEDQRLNRWGADFAILQGQLSVVAIREDGPLYFRGLRRGDIIRRLRWAETDSQGTIRREQATDPAAMLRRLDAAPWDALVAFDYVRGRLPQRSFQMFPAWQQLASLVVDDNRQWAYWSPAGYYDASFEGHKLFGWQVNRGLRALPDFFLAAQLRATLERPEAMSRLLDAGSLDASFRLGRAAAPANPQRAVVDAYYLKPQIEILAPQPGAIGAVGRVRVTAAVTVRDGQQLVPPKVFANGVVGINRALLSAERVAGGRRLVYAWDAPLPSQPEIVLQVVAATEAEMAATRSVTLTRQSLPPAPRPRMFVAAAGINQYLDSQLPRLDFAVNNAKQVAATLNNQAAPLYDIEAISLSNRRVTRSAWNAALQQYADELRDSVQPDDVLVIFLSGHGVRDPLADQYYYIAANARYTDVMGRRYGDCLSLADFSRFADIPCRKLVILDTCHSGALQPLRQRELKAALRALQDDLVFTLTASEGNQEAVEERRRKLGRFTSRLLEALQGAADRQGGDGDGLVSWQEVVAYVRRTVTADSAGDDYRQYPTAGPSELLRVASFPLTAAAPTATGVVSPAAASRLAGSWHQRGQ